MLLDCLLDMGCLVGERWWVGRDLVYWFVFGFGVDLVRCGVVGLYVCVVEVVCVELLVMSVNLCVVV